MLKALQSAIDHGPRSALAVAAILILAVVIPTGLRVALDPHTMRYPTFYPAVMIVTVLLGARAGIVLTIVSGLVVNLLFIPPRLSLAFSTTDLAGLAIFASATAVIILTSALLREALAELKRGQERERALNRELQHRVKNNIAVVQGLAFQISKTTSLASHFYAKFEGRLNALAKAHVLLADTLEAMPDENTGAAYHPAVQRG